MTNFEKVKAMELEELAEHLGCDCCADYCTSNGYLGCKHSGKPCVEMRIKWLESEAE